MDANLTCSPPVKNLTDGEQRSAFRGIFRGEKTDQRKITVGNYTRGVERYWLFFPHLSWFLPDNSYFWLRCVKIKLNPSAPLQVSFFWLDTWGGRAKLSLHSCLKEPPFRARPQRAPSACTSGMKSHCCTLRNYPNPNIHTVILSVARYLHETSTHFCHETALGLPFLKWTECTFGAKPL